jgi:hypothetical protein
MVIPLFLLVHNFLHQAKEVANLTHSLALLHNLDKVLLGMALPNIFDERIPNPESYNFSLLIINLFLTTSFASF